MAPPRRQVGDFLLVRCREMLRVVSVGRHLIGLRHVEPRRFFRAKGQAVGLIEPFEHGHRGIGAAVAVLIRQGHHPALGSEAYQNCAPGVQGQDPGAGDVGGKNRDGKPLGQLQGDGGRIDGFPGAGARGFLQELDDIPRRAKDGGPGPP